MCGQLTQRQYAFEQQTHPMTRKMDLLLKHLGKHEINEYVDETIRKHFGSIHTGGSHQYDEFTNCLHDNLSKMNLGSNSIAQPHTRLPTTGDL